MFATGPSRLEGEEVIEGVVGLESGTAPSLTPWTERRSGVLGRRGSLLGDTRLAMPQENLDLVRSIFAAWERGDFRSVEWAHADIGLEE